MKVISPREWKHIEEYWLEFDRGDGSGLSFPCDKDGKVLNLNPDAQRNYEKALQTPEQFVRGPFVRDFSRDFRTEEIRECDRCKGNAYFTRYCGAFVCTHCDQHDGLARCYCGWSVSGRNGRVELEEMGETIDGDYDDFDYDY